ncbi:hypothetical protein Vadar_022258 [Vaccinium darrowii]|uniref:Uncharacterized protein n=1 Tax=Vaccinium darrowii TaxID=229202 RepID=A0ACB7Y8C5_9ERIC|nr:hypothetical protein Vadar_022258 [Vaccinium darrowii]
MCDIDGLGLHLATSAIIGLDGSVWAQSVWPWPSPFQEVLRRTRFCQFLLLIIRSTRSLAMSPTMAPPCSLSKP